MRHALPTLIFLAGIGQLSVLVASALVPVRLQWRTQLAALPRLVRQMCWVYGGYVVLSIVALGVISLLCAEELAAGGRLARAFCAYVAVFWGVRLGLQGWLDARPYLTACWLRLGYRTLTVLFAAFTFIYGLAALG
jgi:hypothetical protein